MGNRIHRAVVRELTSKGLREVQQEENLDLVVRYWVETEFKAQLTGTTNWGAYGSYYSGYWTVMYTTMSTPVTHKGLLGIELIDVKAQDLAWRLFVSEKIIHNDPDKIWKTRTATLRMRSKGILRQQRPSKRRKPSGSK